MGSKKKAAKKKPVKKSKAKPKAKLKEEAPAPKKPKDTPAPVSPETEDVIGNDVMKHEETGEHVGLESEVQDESEEE